MNSKDYVVFHDGKYQKLSAVFSEEGFKTLPIWSARISTGLFGLLNCSSGNRGPKNYKEILLASGQEGLQKLIDLGFISCPVCKPEETEKFWEQVGGVVQKKYGILSLKDFVDKTILGFDARRLNFEEILPQTGAVPGRLYLPRGLSFSDLGSFNQRFNNIGLDLPPVGYYDRNVEGNFFRYLV